MCTKRQHAPEPDSEEIRKAQLALQSQGQMKAKVPAVSTLPDGPNKRMGGRDPHTQDQRGRFNEMRSLRRHQNQATFFL